MTSSRRSLARATLPVTALAMLMVASIAGPASATYGPEYAASVAPASVAAGTSTASTITIKKLSGARSAVKSVRITPPSGFQLTGGTASRGSTPLTVVIDDGKATVSTNIDVVGATAEIVLTANVPCGVAGADTWTVVAHSTLDYDSSSARTMDQDPASNLALNVARCDLAFDTQPEAAGLDTTITSVAGDPSGTPIRVQLRDGNGNPASQSGVDVNLSITSGTGATGATLGGDTSDATNSDGIAAFAPRIDKIGSDYRLDASAGSGIGGATSSQFAISGVAVACSGDCSGNQTSGDTGATVSAESTGLLTISVGLGDVDCNNRINGYYKGTSEAVTFNVTGGLSRTTVTIKLDKASVNKPLLLYGVCFSSPASEFKNWLGKTIAAGEAGVLPHCLVTKLRHSDGPCMVSRRRDGSGNLLVTFSVPTGDPRGKI